MHTCVAFTFWLVWVMLLWIQVYKYMFQFLLSKLEYMHWSGINRLFINLCLRFWQTAILFSRAVTPFYSVFVYDRMIGNFIDLPPFANPFIHWWVVQLFLSLGQCQQCCCKYLCISFYWTPDFNSLWHMSRNGILEPNCNFIFLSF